MANEKLKQIARRYETGKIGFYQALEEAFISGILDDDNEAIMHGQVKEIVRLRKALKDIMECTGSSTLQYKIARDAIVEIKIPKSDNLNTYRW